jgi:hypothetical protein
LTWSVIEPERDRTIQQFSKRTAAAADAARRGLAGGGQQQ